MQYVLRYGEKMLTLTEQGAVEVPGLDESYNRDVIVWCHDHTIPPSHPNEEREGKYKHLSALLRGGQTPCVDYADVFLDLDDETLARLLELKKKRSHSN